MEVLQAQVLSSLFTILLTLTNRLVHPDPNSSDESFKLGVALKLYFCIWSTSLKIGDSAGPECKEALQEVTRLVDEQLQSGRNSVKQLFGASTVMLHLIRTMNSISFGLITFQCISFATNSYFCMQLHFHVVILHIVWLVVGCRNLEGQKCCEEISVDLKFHIHNTYTDVP